MKTSISIDFIYFTVDGEKTRFKFYIGTYIRQIITEGSIGIIIIHLLDFTRFSFFRRCRNLYSFVGARLLKTSYNICI